jgi:hypothetical protein
MQRKYKSQKDPSTVWTLGIPVLRIQCATPDKGQVVRFKDPQQIWP